ncbi:MAG: transcriptional repressor [Coprobacillus sp.]|nr:transcriptional repressor [Coprobacillus sp.]
MTHYEQTILDIVLSSHEHPTAEQVFFLAKEEEPNISMATVYNNLNKLVNENKIRKISIDGHADRYDSMVKHSHLYCVKCHSIKDVMFDDLTEELAKRVGVDPHSIDSYDLTINYICDDCLNKS